MEQNEDHKPKPYDFSKPEEIDRWFREMKGYLKATDFVNKGTDEEGRRFALEAFDKIRTFLYEQGKSDRDKELVAFFKKDLKELSVEDKLKALSPNGIFQAIADDWKHDNEIKQKVANEILDLLDYRILIITNELKYENITSNFALEMSHRLSESRNLKCLLNKKYLNPTQFECKGQGSNNAPDIDKKGDVK